VIRVVFDAAADAWAALAADSENAMSRILACLVARC